MDVAAQMRAEYAGLHRTADNARRAHRLGTVTQKVLGASAHRATQENRSRAIPAQMHAECVGLPRSVAQTRTDRNALRRNAACNRHRTSTEQCSALPSKGAALPANNKPPRTKGLPWWNLLANLTVMPLRQPTSKRILPNTQDSWCGFS